MTIKEHIEKFIEQNNIVLDFLETIPDYANEDLLIPDFIKILESSNYNPVLGINLLMTLQLLNDPKNYDQFELTDLRSLHNCLTELQPYELDTYIEKAHFEWAVMDDGEKAKEVILQGIEKAKEKIAELERLNETINKSK